MMIAVAAQAAVVVAAESPSAGVLVGASAAAAAAAGVQVDEGIGRGIAQYRDTHLLRGEDAIPLLSLRPLRSDARQLTLLRMREVENRLSVTPGPRKACRQLLHLLQQARTRRWVTIHRSRRSYCSGSFHPSTKNPSLTRAAPKLTLSAVLTRRDLLRSRQLNCARDCFVRR